MCHFANGWRRLWRAICFDVAVVSNPRRTTARTPLPACDAVAASLGNLPRQTSVPSLMTAVLSFPRSYGVELMSDAVGPGDLVLCVNAAPNHVTGQPVPLIAGETYRVIAVMDFVCPCGRSDALLDVGVDFAWCQTRFRLLPKPKAEKKPRRVSAPKEKETVR
jgi:hypothetical protein